MSRDYNDIAIVGMACRAPMAANVDEFWDNIQAGRECFTTFTDEQLMRSGITADQYNDPRYVRTKGYIDNIEMFDLDFFDFTPQEARTTDPQHRLFLECAWEALEHAGYSSDKYDGRIGVFAGQSLNEYLLFNLLPHIEKELSATSLQYAIGNDKDSLTTKVSYKMNLNGPGITIQSSSSTSLVSVAVACQNLLLYESDMALAGGVCLGIPQAYGCMYQEGGIISLDGHCRTFDNASDGFVISSGAGIVVLKRLEDAIVDNDTIYAVIKGICTNNDGNTKASYSAPSVMGIAQVVADALELANVSAENIEYIETHGTGTRIGDPIEIRALQTAYERKTHKKNYCAIGSVKTNIGHIDTAAGVIGLIKAAMCLRNKKLPPHVSFEMPNHLINLIDSPFYINTQLKEWVSNRLRHAAVTSIGMGGTNAHAILEEYVPDKAKENAVSHVAPAVEIFTLSAKTELALQKKMEDFLAFLEKNEVPLNKLSYTLQLGRKDFQYRIGYTYQNRDELVQTLRRKEVKRCMGEEGRAISFHFTPTTLPCTESFHALYDGNQCFKDCVDDCLEHIKGYTHIKDLSELFIKKEYRSLTDFVYRLGLAKLVVSWGLAPQRIRFTEATQWIVAHLINVLPLHDAIRGELKYLYQYQEIDREALISRELITQAGRPGLNPVTCVPCEGMLLWENTGAGTAGTGENIIAIDPQSERQLADMICSLWLDGHTIQWSEYYRGREAGRIALPLYQFQRKYCWVDSGPTVEPAAAVEKKKAAGCEVDQDIGEQLHDLWCSLLGNERIEPDENYFELGGNSLLATQIVYQINHRFGTAISLVDFYTAPTLRTLADTVKGHILQAAAGSADSIADNALYTQEQMQEIRQHIHGKLRSASVEDAYPLTPSQERILFNSLYYRRQNYFFQHYTFDIHGTVDVSILLGTVNRLQKKHRMLRTTFLYHFKDKPMQVVLDRLPIDFLFRDISSVHDTAAAVEEYMELDAQKPFKLFGESLMRMSVFEISPICHKVVLSIHHIIMDGWSMRVLTDDFLHTYLELSSNLPGPFTEGHDYKEYVRWIHRQDNTLPYSFWRQYLNEFNGKPLFASKAGKLAGYDNIEMLISADQLGSIRNYASEHKVTINTLIKAVWSIILHKLTETTDMLFGVVVSGRPATLRNSTSMIGLFANVVPERVRIRGEMLFSELIQAINVMAPNMQEHDYLPLMDILKNSDINPGQIDHILDLNTQDISMADVETPFRIGNLEYRQKMNYPFSLIAITTNEGIQLKAEFYSSLIERGFAGRMLEWVGYLLSSVVEDKEQRIDRLKETIGGERVGGSTKTM